MLADQVVITEGTVFAISDPLGDMPPASHAGFYARDTRFLSTFTMTLQGAPLRPLGSHTLSHATASFFGTNARKGGLLPESISIVRDRLIAHDLHEDISVINHAPLTQHLRLALTFHIDFADVFEVRQGRVRRVRKIRLEPRPGQHLCFVYSSGGFRRETWVAFSQEPVLRGRRALFDLTLGPKDQWQSCIHILPVLERPPRPTPCPRGRWGSPFAPARPSVPSPSPLRRPRLEPETTAPTLETDDLALRLAYEQAMADLQALRIPQPGGRVILAAGLPWFMAIFGRDAIIAALQSKLLGPEVMVGTLHTLAGFQARERDDFRDAEPGKLPHEVRTGELAVVEQVPHSRYYGSVDATPLFLILLSEAYRWTGDTSLLHQFLPVAEAALSWVDSCASRDPDGFVTYRRRSPRGLRNQGWKDSADAIAFPEGPLAPPPIALVEVQGYVYDAKRRMAEIHRVLGDEAQADRSEQEATLLKQRFNEAFWMPEEGFYALALDGRRRQVKSIASNVGHCLWSGIVDEAKAPAVVARLLAEDLFNGWGVRTLSSFMVRYNPLSYHNGCVWPHDNSLIAAGMARYGFHKEAHRVIRGIFEASTHFPQHRLPELFCGFPRRELSAPVPYPAANAPQAWASGAMLLMLETLLGISVQGERLYREAALEGPMIRLHGVLFRGVRRTL